MADAHEDGVGAAATDGAVPQVVEVPDVGLGAGPGDEEHAAMGAALDEIETALDDASATIARMP